MRTQGFEVALRADGYRVPPACASCMGPRQTSVVLQTARYGTGVTTILRMTMPYCTHCAARVPGAGWRTMVLFSLVTLLAMVLPGMASFVSIADLSTPLVAAVGATAAFVLAVPLTLLLLPGAPPAPATARGEAVSASRYTEEGNVLLFCTNAAFAERLAAGNRAPMQPSSRLRLAGPAAIGWCAMLAGAMVFLAWYGDTFRPAPHTPSSNTRPAGKAPAPKRK